MTVTAYDPDRFDLYIEDAAGLMAESFWAPGACAAAYFRQYRDMLEWVSENSGTPLAALLRMCAETCEEIMLAAEEGC